MNPLRPNPVTLSLDNLAAQIKTWGLALGFDAVGISDTDLADAELGLQEWLAAGYHGDMDYMEKHGMKRARPAELVPGTLRVITVRLPYLPGHRPDENLANDNVADIDAGWRANELSRLHDATTAVVSLYARGRDYHKVLRHRLQRLADRITAEIGPFGYRAFTDSAPVLEVELARRAGVGWRGKHTLALARDAGSFFFLGELFVDLPLPIDEPAPRADGEHCGSCTRCLDVCPTRAIVAPYRLDARRCISYLTIEFGGSIPLPFREAIGNRIYGCDDCQLICPWNKYATRAAVPDFDVRNDLDRSDLTALFAWSETDFETRLAGTAIRRIGHERWLRNIAVALGNALRTTPAGPLRELLAGALQQRANHTSALVREHVTWALRQVAA